MGTMFFLVLHHPLPGCRLALRNDRSYIGSTTRSAQFVPGRHPRRPDIYGRIRVRIRLVPARQT